MNYDHNTKLASHLLFEYKKVSGQCSYEDWLLLRLQGFLSHDGPLLASHKALTVGFEALSPATRKCSAALRAAAADF